MNPERNETNGAETPRARQKKPYTAPIILFSTKVEARAVVCSKADGNCTLGPVSS